MYLHAPKKAVGSGLGFFIFFMIWAFESIAQQGMISGQVKDEETALQNVTIYVAEKWTITNAKGEFSIAVSPGRYTLVVTHSGYRKLEQEIIVHANEKQTLSINMIRAGQMDEVVILGSRSITGRSNLATAVPVDCITSTELKQTGQPSLIQMLNFSAPSFNTSRQHLTDPVTLRGLSPDHMLILLNGTRYHNLSGINDGSIRGTLGRGSVSNDLNAIPFSAIEKIEILRDGASAQYGSDAIAGVLNIELKKTTGKTCINLHLGQHYKGDGESVVVGINRGISLNKKGFLNFSGDFRYRKPTHRGGEFDGTVYYILPFQPTPVVRDSIVALDNKKIGERGFNRKTAVSNDGSIQLSSLGFLVNGGYAVTKQVELFWTGAVNYRHPVVRGAYRFPKNPNQVDTILYPDGFKPVIIVNSWDVSVITGARGSTHTGWTWEWNSVYGSHSARSYYHNTNNASQVPFSSNAQTSFYNGSSAFLQQINTLGLARDFAKEISRVKTFTIGFGAEYRFEKYRTGAGEEPSWQNYDMSRRTQPGAQPAPGRNRDDVVNESRSVAGLYVDLETDIDDHFLITMAGRMEHYNGFGSNLAGKLAMRYKLSSVFSVRSSVSNGYHAPALQQMYYSATIAGSKNVGGTYVPVRLGIFSNNSTVARAFDIKTLQPEKAVNLSGGLTSIISPHINLTVDAYWIQIKNRIVLSGIFKKTNPEVTRILQNFPDVDQVQFLTNAINTRTSGIDVVMNGDRKIGKASIGLMLAANFTRTHIFGAIQSTGKLSDSSQSIYTLFNREEKENMEHGQPAGKIIISANYKLGKACILVRSTRFGKTSIVFDSDSISLDQAFSAKTLIDLSFTYTPKSWINITAGVNNVFDVYPDRLKNPGNKNNGILIYSNQGTPFGYNGGYYFVGMAFDF
jgi:iron complex outermembrane receptor protein